MGRNLGMGLKRGERPKNWKENCKKFVEYYRKHHPDWTEEQCQEAVNIYSRENNWQCIEYYQKRFPKLTDEERLKLMNEKQHQSQKNRPFFIEYYRERFPNASEEECQKMLSDYAKRNNCQNIEYYRERFPNASEEECQMMLEKTKQNYKATRPDNSGINNPAHHSKTTELQRKQRSPMCIEFYELKYPDLTDNERQALLLKHKNLIKEKMKDKTIQYHCVEYWLARGYTLEESKKIISEHQHTFSLEKCIQKYGVEEGTKRFNERQINWQKSLHNALKNNTTNGKTQSKFANSIIKIIKDFYKGEKEFLIDQYSYDFRYKNKLIEFNGDYWHMNPMLFRSTDINKTTNQTAQEIWDRDEIKKQTAINNNYKLLIIWENEYNSDPGNVIKKCLKFLNE